MGGNDEYTISSYVLKKANKDKQEKTALMVM